MSILDSYAYRPLVRVIFVERELREDPNEIAIAGALLEGARCLKALDNLVGDGPWLAGPDLSLADLHAAPMLVYLHQARDGAALLTQYPAIGRWLERIVERPSVVATRTPLER